MKTKNVNKTILTVAAAVLLLASCKGVGIFSTLAVSEKVIDGSLPEGISANEGVLYPSGIDADWAFFSAGPSMLAKDLATAGSKWQQIPLPTVNNEFAIQSIAYSPNNIVLSAIGTSSGGDRTTTLYYVGAGDINAGDGSLTYNPIVTWTSSDTQYYSASVFNAGGTFYINRLTYDGEFADKDAELSASELFSWSGSLTGPIAGFNANLNTAPNFRYITGVSENGQRFTVQDEDSEGGLLLTNSGAVVPSLTFNGVTSADFASRPMTGISWLGAPVSAYFMGITTISGANGALLVSSNGTDWYTVDGIDDDDTYMSFIDVSAVDGCGLVLAGRDLGGEDGGYEHIDVSLGIGGIADWTVSDDDFSDASSYTSTDMDVVSITGFTIIPSATSPLTYDTLFASTRSAGIYSINASATDNDWVEE